MANNPADAAFRQALDRISTQFKVTAAAQVPVKDRKNFWNKVHELASSLRNMELGYYIRYNKGERVLVNMGTSWTNPRFFLGSVTRVGADMTYVVLDTGATEGFKPTKSGVGIIGRARGNLRSEEELALKDIPAILEESSPWYGRPYGNSGDSPFFLETPSENEESPPSLIDPKDPAYRPSEEEEEEAAKDTKDRGKAAKDAEPEAPEEPEEEESEEEEEATGEEEEYSEEEEESEPTAESEEEESTEEEETESEEEQEVEPEEEEAEEEEPEEEESEAAPAKSGKKAKAKPKPKPDADSEEESEESEEEETPNKMTDEEVEEEGPSRDGPPAEDEKECRRCGENNPEDARYCRRCGYSFADEEREEEDDTGPKGKGKTTASASEGRVSRYLEELDIAIGTLASAKADITKLSEDQRFRVLAIAKASVDSIRLITSECD